MQDLEPVYDLEIAPLMTQIITICKRHQLPFVASFQLNDGPEDDEGEGPLMCTSTVLPVGSADKLGQALNVIKAGWVASPPFFALTITTKAAP